MALRSRRHDDGRQTTPTSTDQEARVGSRRYVATAASVAIAVATLTGCGDDGDAEREYVDKLSRAGYESVTVSPEIKKSLGRKNRDRKNTVAYDYTWQVNTDSDPTTCEVTLEHPAYNSKSLRGDHWHVDEVDDKDVEGWGGNSPDPETVRKLLREHSYDC
ncbi:hypothetical protein [Micromonospora coxensis]|uniref:Uncharacterized protein n=1 Tax=Micromonospora coxensis TaxID=356852 RepID=A0A1C5GTE9_9ACTN|nr:hypothetical protein [Micromonospora coxensis]SCG37050.1 hypothetical protein GA0070614_0353 [Micromonospora coxensis]